MSKRSLAVLKSDIHTEESFAYNTQSNLNSLSQTIGNAIDDKVGQSAKESLAGIINHFTLNMDSGLQSAARMAEALETSYIKSDSLCFNAEDLCARANLIVKELSEI